MPLQNWHLDSGLVRDQGSVGLVLAGLGATISFYLTGLSIAHSWLLLEVRTQLVADLAAIAAADTVTGIIAGIPCENAREIATGNGASLDSCRIVSEVVSIRVGKQDLLFQVFASAEAAAVGAM